MVERAQRANTTGSPGKTDCAPEGAPEWSAHNGQTKADGSPRHLRGALIGWGSVIRWCSSACGGLDGPATFPQPAGLNTHRTVWLARFAFSRNGFAHGFPFPQSSGTITGLPSGTRIYTRIRAIGPNGPGPWSDLAGKMVP